MPVLLPVHELIKSVTPLFLQDWLKELFLWRHFEDTVTPEVLEDIMSPHRSNLPIENEIVVVLSLGFVFQCIESFSHLDKSLFRLLISWIGLRVVFKSKSPERLFDVVEGGVSGNLKHIVVVPLSFRVILLKELLFIWILNAILIIKTLKYFVSILNRILTVK